MNDRETYQHQLYPDERGRYGAFGGKFVPESLMAALADLEAAYEEVRSDDEFQSELQAQLASFVGRATTLHHVPRFSQMVAPGIWSTSSAKTWHTPAHTKSITR